MCDRIPRELIRISDLAQVTPRPGSMPGKSTAVEVEPIWHLTLARLGAGPLRGVRLGPAAVRQEEPDDFG